MGIVLKLYLWIRKHCFHIDDRSQLEIAVENGLQIGKNANIQDGVIIDPSHCWLVEIGDNVTLAPRVHVLAHDASTKRELGYTRIGNVRIGNNVFIGANSTVLPGVSIGNNVVIGANSVVTHDIPGGVVAVGNPCKVIKSYDEYMKDNLSNINSSNTFNGEYLIGTITDDKKKEMKKRLEKGIGYII